MLIEFDPAKDAGNRAKHGVALSLAAAVDWGEALVWVDSRYDYGECRMVALAAHEGTLYCVAFVDRGTARRIISLRRANRREVKHYVQHTETPPDSHAVPNAGPDHHGGGQGRS